LRTYENGLGKIKTAPALVKAAAGLTVILAEKQKAAERSVSPVAAKKGKKENIPVVGQLQENVVNEATGERNLKNKKT
jgi:hypothetical protein